MGSTSHKLTINTFSFEEIKIGDTYSFERVIDAQLMESFARISGDYNPIHMDAAFAAKTQFGGRIVHGMLMASFFSSLVGMLCPGLHCLYLSQEVRFKKPVLLNTKVRIQGTVIGKSEATRIIVLKTVITANEGIIVVEGEARVTVLL